MTVTEPSGFRKAVDSNWLRLGLAEDLGEFHHAEGATGRERQQAQPRGLGTGAQGGEQGLHGA